MTTVAWFWLGFIGGFGFGVALGAMLMSALRRESAPAPTVPPQTLSLVFPSVAHHLAPPAPAVVLERGSADACAVCGQTPNPVRFHDGRYLCAEHKG